MKKLAFLLVVLFILGCKENEPAHVCVKWLTAVARGDSNTAISLFASDAKLTPALLAAIKSGDVQTALPMVARITIKNTLYNKNTDVNFDITFCTKLSQVTYKGAMGQSFQLEPRLEVCENAGLQK